MSSLWERKGIKQLKTINKRPSPKHKIKHLSPAQDLISFSDTQFPFKDTFLGFIERISLFTFCSGKISASMTVEAAVVLPLFLFFFVNLSCAIEMIRLHGNLELAMWEVGNRMSIYGYMVSSGTETEEYLEGDDVLEEVADVAFSYTYIKGEVVEYAGEKYLNQSPLLYGTDGLQFVESDIFTSEDTFEVVLTYAVSPWLRMAGVRPFRMANRYYGHIWNGYHIPGTGSAGGSKQEVVYVAENGTVYHEDKHCTHLEFSIKETAAFQVVFERNERGGKYTLCEKCGHGEMPENVFICSEGNRFHYTEDCAGLKRTVYTLTRKDAEKYQPCSRCSE